MLPAVALHPLPQKAKHFPGQSFQYSSRHHQDQLAGLTEGSLPVLDAVLWVLLPLKLQLTHITLSHTFYNSPFTKLKTKGKPWCLRDHKE